MTQMISILKAMAQSEPTRVTFEDIVVMAFKADPKAFSMRGYPQHPDSKKIGNSLFGRRNAVDRGYIRRTGSRFILTELGYEVVARES